MAGAWLGLVRLGWPLTLPWPDQLIAHGALMTGGFLGTLIGLERAVALGRPWAYSAPLLSGTAALALTFSVGRGVGPISLTLGSGLLTLASWIVWRRFRSLSLAVMTLGAATWTIGNVWWLLWGSVSQAAWWWLGFLVLTIAGERLELSRLLAPGRRPTALFLLLVALLLAGGGLTARWPEPGVRLAGLALLGLAAWLARYDVARRSLDRPGQPRFVALALLAGYAWLAIGGALAAATGAAWPSPARDAVLHAVFVGFVLSMVFGHAPVVFPVIAGRSVPYRPAAYLPLLLLHGSLIVRLVGDLIPTLGRWRAWGGLGHALALATFLAVTMGAARRARAGTP